MGYQKVPDGMDFSTEFDTYIIAYCPDLCEWFATNKRFFYFEYEKEFPTESDAVAYFKSHVQEFYDIEIQIAEYRPSFAFGKVWLSTTNEIFECGGSEDAGTDD